MSQDEMKPANRIMLGKDTNIRRAVCDIAHSECRYRFIGVRRKFPMAATIAAARNRSWTRRALAAIR